MHCTLAGADTTSTVRLAQLPKLSEQKVNRQIVMVVHCNLERRVNEGNLMFTPHPFKALWVHSEAKDLAEEISYGTYAAYVAYHFFAS
jgi:hypothetical protein